MQTRSDYLNKKISYKDYYEQFVDDDIITLVKKYIGIKPIKNSSNDYFTDIKKWDAISSKILTKESIIDKINKTKEGSSHTTGVSIAKAAARIIKRSNG